MSDAAIVIVGGGVLGASTAYHLALGGMRDVVLVERMDLAVAASCQAAGLMLQVSSKPEIDQLSRATFMAIDALEDKLGESLDFHRVGTLRMAETERGCSALKDLYARAMSEKIPAEMVDEARLSGKLPWLRSSPEAVSLFLPDEGYVDPYRLTMAYARAARQCGVRIRTGLAVRSIGVDGGRITGLETSEGRITAGKVVVAAGAWSNTLTQPLDAALPMVPTRSHFWMTAPDPMFTNNQPMTIHPDAGVYTRPETGRMLIGVQEPSSRTFDCRLLPDDIGAFPVTEDGEQWDALAEAEERITGFFPKLGEMQIESYTSGLSTYTPDGHFVVGEIDSIPGLFVAGGCCGSGIMASGGIGKALAGLILEGESFCDLTPFRPDRFGKVDPGSAAFQARCAKARAGKAG